MTQELRRKVLECFKQLHRTRLIVFQGDVKALTAAREKINTEFYKNKTVSNAAAIEELITYGRQVEEVLRTRVLQVVEKNEGVYSAKIRPELTKVDSGKSYTPMPNSMIGPFKKKKTPCNNT